MKRSLVIAISAGIDLVAAWVFYANGMVPVAAILLAAAVIAALFAFLQWRRGL